MKTHKCSFCNSESDPIVAFNDRSSVWEMTARVFCSCGAKVTITIPIGTSVTKGIDEKLLKGHVLSVALSAWNSLNH